MKGLKPYFEEFHKTQVHDRGREARPWNSRRKYINDRKLPDKAIDVIDETGASQMLVPEKPAASGRIGVKEIEATIATMARIPAKTVSKDGRRWSSEEPRPKDLKRVVYGQNECHRRR